MGAGVVFMIQGYLSGDGMNSFQNASHSGIIGIAPFLLLLRMLMIFCFTNEAHVGRYLKRDYPRLT